MHLRSKCKRMWPRMAVGCFVIAAGVVTAGVVSGWAQQPGAAPGAAKPAPIVKQPSLTVDRDPVASPDVDPPAQAQTGAPQGVGLAKIEREGGKYTLRQDAYEVRLNATVLDGSGRSVQTLTKDAFSVYEDGVPQTIASFRHEDLPVSLGLLIDSSGSMYDKRSAVEKAALDFVKLSNPADEEFLAQDLLQAVDLGADGGVERDRDRQGWQCLRRWDHRLT